MALSQYIPLYTYLPDRYTLAEKKIDDLIGKISGSSSKKKNGNKLIANYLKEEFGVDVKQDELAKILKYRNLTNLFEGILTIEEAILQGKIVSDSNPFAGKKRVEILYPDPVGIVIHFVNEITTLKDAKLDMEKKISQLFWQVDKRVLNLVIRISVATLLPNLKYDEKENNRRIEKIIRMYPSKVICYNPGDILTPFRKILSEEDIILLNDYREDEKKDLAGNVLWILTAIILAILFYNLFLSRILASGWRKKPPYHLLLILLIITIVLLKIFLLFTNFSVWLLPFCSLPLLAILLNNERTSATCTMAAGAFLVSLFSGPVFEIILFFIFGGVVVILASGSIQKRIHILIPSLLAGAINAGYVLIYSLDWKAVVLFFENLQKNGTFQPAEIFNMALFVKTGWAFAGGLIAGPATLFILPLMEVSRHTASTFKLNRYIDLQHPLMRDLLAKAPGTYQHTMSVAYFAQAAGEAVGADKLLLNIGAYYHDIGKILNPKFFVENQFVGKNSHDDLDPAESAEIIIRHVEDGKRIAQDAGLPEAVQDLIMQHHGTQLVEYFYNKAANTNHGAEPAKEEFRYPGPKPQSIEAAILMIVDAVEAASRSLQEPTKEEINNMIHHIIEKRIADGQFSDCDLSTRDITKIERALIESLEAALHSRIMYPWQKKKEEETHETGKSSDEEKEEKPGFKQAQRL